MIKEMFQGFCMALADSVPGVSGGTIAYLMGFYDRFISCIKDLTSFKSPNKKASAQWMAKFLLGWASGMGLASVVLTAAFTDHIYQVSSLFLGFMIPATFLMLGDEALRQGKRACRVICFAGGLGLVLAITCLRGHFALAVDLSALNTTTCLLVFLAGGVAVSAMILPGISGSALLLILGLYLPLIQGLRGLVMMDFSTLPALCIFACGIVCGLLVVVRLIKKVMARFPAYTVSAVIGMMGGSFYAIIQGPMTLENPQPALGISNISLLFLVMGAMLVVLLKVYRSYNDVGKRAKRKRANTPAPFYRVGRSGADVTNDAGRL